MFSIFLLFEILLASWVIIQYFLNPNEKVLLEDIAWHLERYKNEPAGNYEVLMEERFTDGAEATRKEKYILNKYHKYLVSNAKLLKDGNTEVFGKDVLKLDLAK